MGNTSGKPVIFTDEGKYQLPPEWTGTSSSQPERSIIRCSLPLTALAAVNLNHFRLLRVVGKGAFGKVRIVERKDTGLTFALKYIRKDEGWWHRFAASSV